MRPHFLFALVLLALVPFIQAHSGPSCFPCHCEDRHSYTVSFGTAPDANTRQVIQEMSRGNDMGLYKTSYSILYHSDVYLNPVNESLRELDILIGINELSGDTRYKTFDISQFLVPSEIKAVVNLDAVSLSAHDTVTLSRTSENGPYHCNILLELSDMSNQDLSTISISDVRPLYTMDDVQRLLAFLEVIDDYYISDAILDSAVWLLNRCENGYALGPADKTLNLLECDNIIHHLDDNHLNESLPLAVNDPLSYISTFDGIRYRYHRTKSTVSSTSALLDKSVPAGILDNYARDYTARFMRFIELSYKVNFYEVTSYHELANVSYTQARIGSFSSLFWRDRKPRNLDIQRLAGAIVRQWIDQAKRKLDDEQFFDAFVPINNADALIRLTYCIPEETELNQVRLVAYHGMYDSYLNLAQRFYQIGNLQMCDEYLAKAFDVSREAPSILQTDTLFHTIASNIASIHIQRATTLPDTLYGKKLGCLDQAKGAVSKYFPDDPLLDSITLLQLAIKEQQYMVILGQWETSLELNNVTQADFFANQVIRYATSNLSDPAYQEQAFGVIRKIHGYTYQTLLYEAERLIATGDQPGAAAKLEEAEILATAHGIAMSPAFLSLMLAIYKPVFMEKISRGRMHIWLNDRDKADAIYSECQDMAEQNHLVLDPEVLQSLKEFKDLLNQK